VRKAATSAPEFSSAVGIVNAMAFVTVVVARIIVMTSVTNSIYMHAIIVVHISIPMMVSAVTKQL
jgi:hypothetical protein